MESPKTTSEIFEEWAMGKEYIPSLQDMKEFVKKLDENYVPVITHICKNVELRKFGSIYIKTRKYLLANYSDDNDDKNKETLTKFLMHMCFFDMFLGTYISDNQGSEADAISNFQSASNALQTLKTLQNTK